ncbi:hypothetical protein COL39_15450 [Bacillus cereus]|uniref:hypothetical protein n=1 Tax=Bacillus cereus TaxID=1396 RepID=UPI000BFA1F79|nr:hypothetical protein [Bacillus cereus]PFX73143.1 hypothetical protein COL39_15450 [Bacillus cereus]
MILNQVTYAGEEILNILHKGLDNQINTNRNLNAKRKIGRYNLIFNESFVSDDFLAKHSNYLLIDHGLLHPNHELNPYSGTINATCAFMTRYVSKIKPNKIIKTYDDRLELNIPSKDLLSINTFIKEYTGLDLNYNPILFGDTLLYEHTYINIQRNETNGIKLSRIAKKSMVIVKFKSKTAIVYTNVTLVAENTTDLEINSSVDWHSLDIEVYEDNSLVYFDYDVAFFDGFQLNLSILDRPKKVKLNMLDDFFELKSTSVLEEYPNGEVIEELEELFSKSNYQMRKKLLNEQERENITFIKPRETQKSISLISEFFQNTHGEIWIFDPYFTDISRFIKSLDWLRILSECIFSYPINIVFFCKNANNAYDYNTIKEAIETDSILKEKLNNKTLNMNFIQVSSPIHDRFIIGKTNKDYSGLTIGTSLNSIDNNYFCINTLNHSAAQKVLTELTEYIEKDKIIGKCKV